MTMSAPVSSARARPMARASAFSGLGGFDRGEAAVLLHLLGHGVDGETGRRKHLRGHGAPCAVDGGKDDLGRVGAQDFTVEEVVFKMAAVGFIKGSGEGDGAFGLDVEVLCDFSELRLVDFVNDTFGVRIDHLSAIGEVDFVAVVVGRVVAGGDDDAGGGVGGAHGEAEVGRGTRAVEDHGVATQAGSMWRR